MLWNLIYDDARSQILLAPDRKVSKDSIMAVLQISRSTIEDRKAYLTNGSRCQSTAIHDLGYL
jgi:hypothetical protein